MKKKHILLLFSAILWIVVLIIGFLPFPQHPYRSDGESKIDMKDQMSIYVDKQKEIEFDQLDEVEFEDYKSSGAAGSLSDATFWIKIELPEDRIENNIENNKNVLWLLEIAKPQLDFIRYYQVDKNNSLVKTGELGRKFPFKQRAIMYRNFVIPLDKTVGISSVYLEIQTKSYLQAPVILWKAAEFYRSTSEEHLLKGIFYGALFIMIIYNGILGLVLKDKVYYYYMGGIISYSLLQGVWDGFSYQYLWPNAPTWDQMANPFFINSSLLCLLAFTKHFLKIYPKHIYLARCYFTIMFSAAAAMFGVFFLPSHISIHISIILAILSIAICFWSICINRLNSRPEKIYMIAWQFLLAGNTLNILAALKIYPYTIVTMNAPKLGLIALLTMFSLALADRINQVENQKRLVKLASQMDGLTKVYNRTHFFKEVEEMYEDAEFDNFALMMLDIDYFKNINDTYGHLQGDVVLQIVIPAIKEVLGQEGIMGRYGGDEFIIAIPKQSNKIVIDIAENIRQTVKAITVYTNQESIKYINVTVSIGIACKNTRTNSLEELIEEADKALYKAKFRGRDQIALESC